MSGAATVSQSDSVIEEIAHADLPSAYTQGGLLMRAFRNKEDGIEHLALVKGDAEPGALIRVHSECLTGDALGSLRCDCGDQLRAAMRLIGESRSGALLYIRGHEGRGIGLGNKVAAYELQDRGFDTVEANSLLGFKVEARDYRAAAEIIQSLGFSDIRLLTNNPQKRAALERYGVRVSTNVPLVQSANPYNAAYLATKRDKMGHLLPSADNDGLDPGVATFSTHQGAPKPPVDNGRVDRTGIQHPQDTRRFRRRLPGAM